MTSLICSPVMISRHNSGTLPAACLMPSWHRAAETIHLGAEMCCCSLTLALSQSRDRGAGWKGSDILDHFLNSASACPKNYCVRAGIVTGREVEGGLTGLQAELEQQPPVIGAVLGRLSASSLVLQHLVCVGPAVPFLCWASTIPHGLKSSALYNCTGTH